MLSKAILCAGCPTVVQTSSIFTPRQQRAAHALLGSVVADAATRPLHWLYDADKVREHAAADNGGDVAFLPESRSPFYSVPTGQQSPYGDTTLAMVRCVQCMPVPPSCGQLESNVARCQALHARPAQE